MHTRLSLRKDFVCHNATILLTSSFSLSHKNSLPAVRLRTPSPFELALSYCLGQYVGHKAISVPIKKFWIKFRGGEGWCCKS